MNRLNNKSTKFDSLQKNTSDSELQDIDVLNKIETESLIDDVVSTKINAEAHRIRINGDLQLNTTATNNAILLSPGSARTGIMVRDGVYLVREPLNSTYGGGRADVINDTEIKISCGFVASELSIVAVSYSCGIKDNLTRNEVTAGENATLPSSVVKNNLYFTCDVRSNLKDKIEAGGDYEIYAGFSIRDDIFVGSQATWYGLLNISRDLVRTQLREEMQFIDSETYTRISLHLPFNDISEIPYNEANDSLCVYVGIKSTGTATTDCQLYIKNAMLHTVDNIAISFTPENKDMDFTGDVNGVKPTS